MGNILKANIENMEEKQVNVLIDIDKGLYLKDPNSSVLGQKILKNSIRMIHSMGFESFTFKKLAGAVGASEPSIYRYFENKHKLLLYLIAWYWNWMDYKIKLGTGNVSSPEERLRISIKLLSQPIEKDENFQHIDEVALYGIVVAESSKVYLIKDVDKINNEGLFLSYKRLVYRAAENIYEINPDYKFPAALMSTVVESSHDQKYFAEHLPALTEISQKTLNNTTEFLTEMVFKTIAK